MVELITNSNCELIICGLPEKSSQTSNFLEVIVYADDPEKYYHYEWNRTNDHLTYEMPVDGLYCYYLIENPEFDKFNIEKDIPNEPHAELFSLCKLRSCVINKEKELIENFARTCNKAGKCEKTETSNVNILLIALFLIEHFVRLGEYGKATILLDKIRSCGGLCEEPVTKTCNC